MTMMDKPVQWRDAEIVGAPRPGSDEVERVMWLIRDRLDAIPDGIPRRHHPYLADALLRVAIERMLAAHPSRAIEACLLDLLASLNVAQEDRQILSRALSAESAPAESPGH